MRPTVINRGQSGHSGAHQARTTNQGHTGLVHTAHQFSLFSVQETIIAYTNCLERGEKGILSLKVNVDWFSLTCNTSGGVRRHCWQLRDNYPAADNMVRKHGGGPGGNCSYCRTESG